MLKFEIRNIIVDEEILGEVHLESFSISLRLSFSPIYFNLICSCISISLIFTVSTPKLLTNSKSSSLTISSSTILLRISNEETLRLKERENENMDEKRRIDEMQMQLKMKELELDFAREK
jgi:HD superfamily phosphohydrolase